MLQKQKGRRRWSQGTSYPVGQEQCPMAWKPTAFQGALTTRKVYSGIVGMWGDGGVWEEADAGEPQANGLEVIRTVFLW